MQTDLPTEGTLPELNIDRPRAAMVIVTSLFFIWGFVTVLNDILIPHLQNVFSLSNYQSMFIQLAFFSAYFIFAMPWGRVVDRVGYRNTMVLGLIVSAVGCLLFLPAALLASYAIFLSAQVVLACGITALQVAANPYVAALGSARTASSRLNLAQAFNSLGTFIAPPIGGLLLFEAAKTEPVKALTGSALHAFQQTQAASVKLPYVLLALILIALATFIRLRLPSFANNTTDIRTPLLPSSYGKSILRTPQVFFAVIGIFLYVGGEVAIGSFLVRYLHLPNIANVSLLMASNLLTLYWGGAMIGRFAGAALLRRIRPSVLLAVFAAIAAALVLTSTLSSGYLAAGAILAVGLFNSIMFPSIFAIGIEGLGDRTSEAASLIVMAIVGGAIIPVAQGKLADHIGIQHALLVPLICYAYILFFGLWGMRRSASAS
jgi:FHS family L-fucose permease-like MFS transporter